MNTPSTPRIGYGADVHRFAPDRKLILCGIEIPHTHGLLGHSDADVATHALMDALLGAAALGDIGKHFPDTDAQYKNADSIKLLTHVHRLITNAGYSISNIDITILAEKPKLAPHIENMRQNLATALALPSNDISVKATTTEGLGFVGELQGIEARAVVLIIGT
jgi:2-C-methyl-D-erythritol 2,4-cyclodiphosphate synthase